VGDLMSNKVEYKSLSIPKVIWDKKSLSNFFGELVAYPLEPGFGTTFGNSLRRILLSAVEGSAVTSVIIKGVNNEFSSIPGVVEDVMQILLNIKQVVVSNKTGEPGKMHLKVSSAGAVTVADITADDHLELINTDHVIANISKDSELEITFFVESGRGYQAAKWPIGKSLQDDDRIHIDAMFSPIKSVVFDIEKVRVGKEIDHDKLILKLQTNGSETPAEVLHYAVSVLGTQFENFLVTTQIPFNEISEVAEELEDTEDNIVNDLGLNAEAIEFLLKPVDELELSARAHNCLISSGKKRILDLVNMSEDEVLKLKNFGRKSLSEVRESMDSFNLSFGTDIKEEDIEAYLKNKNK